VRVQLVRGGLAPYGWEIYDEEDGLTVRRSTARFRSSAAAWHAGMAALADPEPSASAGQDKSQPGRSSQDGLFSQPRGRINLAWYPSGSQFDQAAFQHGADGAGTPSAG
jgi:hypothetical protein